jgi:hypothetical protein
VNESGAILNYITKSIASHLVRNRNCGGLIMQSELISSRDEPRGEYSKDMSLDHAFVITGQ